MLQLILSQPVSGKLAAHKRQVLVGIGNWLQAIVTDARTLIK